MKVLVGHFSHEANTFAEEMVNFEQYTSKGALFGEESIQKSEGTSLYLGGIIKACREENIEMIPTCAYSSAAPVLTRECVDKMMDTILPVCRAHRDELDGICIALHGAGVAEGIDDLEVYVLRELRKIVGPDLPIVVPMDLHGNVSEETAKLANGIFGIRKYPHTDKADISYIAMKTLARLIRKEISIETKIVHLPLLIPIASGMTANAPFPEINAYMDQKIQECGLIYCSLFQGFPYADVACSTASVCVVAEKGAQEAAQDIARFVWDRREQLKANSISPAQAFDLAEKESAEGYIIINDMSDNPGGGCPGDGTHLLREMLKRDLLGSIFGFMCDSAAVEEVWKHRIGDRISLTLGGRHEKIFGDPIRLEDATVMALSDGNFTYTSPNMFGLPGSLGKTVRLRKGNVDIIIASNRAQTFDDQPFHIVGALLKDYRYVALKSTQHFRGYFGDKAAAIIPCDPPGLSTSDLTAFDFKKIPRPVYPLDENVTF